MSAPPPSRWRNLSVVRNLAPLRHRNYALFWVGFASTHTGRWIEQVGAVWLIYELTHSPVMLGLLGVARAVPLILLSPIGGVVADRFDQRKLLFTTQGLGFLVSLALGLLVVSGRVEPWHIYLEVAIQAVITAFDASVRQALFPRLVPQPIIGEAVTLAMTAGRSGKLFGPFIGGVAIASLGEASPFLLNAATFLVLMGALVKIEGIAPKAADTILTFRGDLIEGIRHLMREPVLSGLVKLEIVFGIFQLNPAIITLIGREVLHVGPEGLGGLLSAPALGSLFGIASLLVLRPPLRQGRFVVTCTAAYAAVVAGLGVAGVYPAVFVLLIAVGWLDALSSVTRQSLVQIAAPAHMRGRVVANLGTVTRGTPALAEAQSGLMVAAFGPAIALLSAAGVIGLWAGVTGRFNPAVWRYRRHTGTSKPLAPEPAGLDAAVD